MSTKQSAYFKGNARPQFPTPFKAGDGHTVVFTHVFDVDVNSTDILELMPIPAGCRITGIDFSAENIGAINLTFGIMSGASGDAVSVRTCGSEFIPAVVSTTPTAATLLALINARAASDEARSIGVFPSALIAAGVTKKLHTRLQYAAT